ncbi:MAG: DNA mismatch repair protein MutS [Anaerolineae bacterium]|nr:MAG: DNA mismatch repair protein MutS [Anaerolineae bacterium]
MKVLLLHPDRDFEPKAPLPSQSEALIQDLELETLLQTMAQGDKFLYQTARQVLLNSLHDPSEISYRQDILRDCLTHPEVIRQIYQIPLEAIYRKQKHWMGIFSRTPGGILSSAVQMLEMFVELLRRLEQIARTEGEKFHSAGWQRFFEMIRRELDEAYFLQVEHHLRQLRFREGVWLSARLGQGNEGIDYVLCTPNPPQGHWARKIFSRRSPVYSFTLHPRDEHGARALGDLRDRGLNLVANAAAQSADHIDNFLNALRQELAFYICALNLAEALTAIGMPFCFPEMVSAEQRKHTCTGLYDAALALTVKQNVVGNSLNADKKDLVLITGANQGGKSTFLRSIGQAQLMAQSGLFTAAEQFSANVVSGIFTHYRREEDATMKSGKLDEELGRMSEIASHVRPHALILFNESFAATNEREGSEIARQIVDALLERHIKVFFVTHQYELARGYHRQESPRHLFLRAERKSDGSRSFKLHPAPPLPTSYGVDVYRKIFNT